ncbi:MAG: GNAT family N-acetyltransferase [Deltaproteobacteria bacterium]|nr:GNAT family N-acetyltransferase [Deltaproteobacteria bacterium]
MRHDLRREGPAFRLRPVTLDDADFIVALRTDPRLAQFLNRVSPDVAAQRDWLARYFERPDDYYFIVERRADGGAEGALGIYDLAGDAGARRAEWGRWVLRHGSLAAPESAWLMYQLGFEALGLDLLYCRTLAANQRVVSFHAACGLTTHATLPGFATIDGVAHDVVEQHMTRPGWAVHGEPLLRHAERAARIVERSAKR